MLQIEFITRQNKYIVVTSESEIATIGLWEKMLKAAKSGLELPPSISDDMSGLNELYLSFMNEKREIVGIILADRDPDLIDILAERIYWQKEGEFKRIKHDICHENFMTDDILIMGDLKFITVEEFDGKVFRIATIDNSGNIDADLINEVFSHFDSLSAGDRARLDDPYRVSEIECNPNVVTPPSFWKQHCLIDPENKS